MEKMVFGLEKEKVEIDLDKTNYSPGEIIKGKIILKLKKPIQAEALKISFIGKKEIDGIVNRQTSTGRIFCRSEKILDSENEYFGNIYQFELEVPKDVFEKARNWRKEDFPEGNWRKMAEWMEAKRGVIDAYYIVAILDIKHGLDIKNKIRINIV